MSIEVIKCPACGGQIQIESNNEFGFCSFCGNKIKIRDVLDVRQTFTGIASGESRNNALCEMEKLIEYFDETKPLYAKLKDYNVKKDSIYKHDYFSAFLGIGICVALSGIGVLAGGKIGMGILFLLISIGLIAFGIYQKNKKKSQYNELKRRIDIINEKLLEDYQNYANCPLGFEYTNPEVLHKLYEYVRKGRAYSIKEALNMYLDEN